MKKRLLIDFKWIVFVKDHQSSVLVLVEQNSKNYFAMKLEKNNSSEVLEKIEHIVRINGLVGKIKGIITDRGKKFSKFEEMEKITGSNIYFCDPGSLKQKPKVERMNRDTREYFIKETDFNNITQKEINKVMKIINEKPRTGLGWLSSKEVF